jgi:hypothetical protein
MQALGLSEMGNEGVARVIRGGDPFSGYIAFVRHCDVSLTGGGRAPSEWAR